MKWRTLISMSGHILAGLSFLLMIQSSLTSSGLSYQFAISFIVGLALMIASKPKTRA